ncbi:MAG: PqqD family peptide modification chaperone [Phycisphaerales bacterium]
MKPRLRPHVQIVRQHFRGARWYVVQDPTSNAYFRLNPVAHEFVGLMDGTRTVEEIWELGLTRHADEALTQNEVINVLSQLHTGNLLQGDLSPETEQLLGRGRERVKGKAVQQAIGLMYFRVRLLNPDRLLTVLEPFFRPVINRAGFIAWCVLILAALATVLPHWQALRGQFESTIAPSNWFALGATFVLVKLWHELGHGLICKRFGGSVPEFGAMMLVLMPAPYVDASSAWTFRSKWQRVAVGGGGMMFELALASVMAFVWSGMQKAGEAGLLKQIAYNVMFTSSVSTIVFNANPLMRFDGYYMLSDLLEVPNLMQRSMNMLKFLAQKHLFHLDSAQAPTSSPTEAVILLVYGIGAFIYRIVVFFSITLYIMGKMFAIGLLLAAWTAAMWFILPVASFLRWLVTNPGVQDRRARTWGVTTGLVVAAVLIFGVIPLPDHRRADGVVESTTTSGVFAGAQGTITQVHARTGQHVKQGDPIATLAYPELDAMVRLARAQLAEHESLELLARTRSPAEHMVAEKYVESDREQLTYLESQSSAMVVRAPQDGVLAGGDLSQFVGRLVSKGDMLCEVVDPADVHVAAMLSQQQADWIATLAPQDFDTEVRRASRVRDTIPVVMTRPPAAARRELPHAALGYQGGGKIETRAGRVQSGEKVSTRPLFNAHFSVRTPENGTAAPALGMPGERVFLRFSLPSRPLLAQWIDRVRQAVQGRAKV